MRLLDLLGNLFVKLGLVIRHITVGEVVVRERLLRELYTHSGSNVTY